MEKNKVAAELTRAYATYAREVFEYSKIPYNERPEADERMRNKAIGARFAISELAEKLGVYINFQSIIDEIAKEYDI